jgi:NADP-dependent 3-hydroxy acid dehydrogenase YdfG
MPTSTEAKRDGTMLRLTGKRAIVLGCGGRSNIGQAIARRFISDGATLVIAGRKESVLAEFADEIGARYCLCDITNRASNLALAAFARDALGGVDIAIQSTGWGYLAPFLNNDEDSLERITRLQFLGRLFFFQAMIPALAGGGSLVTISSVTASSVTNDHAAYQGTKAGIDQIVSVLAAEFGQLIVADKGRFGTIQIADGRADVPREQYRYESLNDRKVPGEGALPLRAYLEQLPSRLPLEIEVPQHHARDAGVSPDDRVRRAVTGARSVLAQCRTSAP